MGAEEFQSLYSLVVKRFTELGADPQSMRRTILLRQNRLIGLRFDCGSLRAVAPLGGGAVEFYGEDGRLLGTAALTAVAEMKKAA